MSDIHSAFVRQRRSLVLISAILSVVIVFGITGTDVRLAPGAGSVTVDIQNPNYIVGALWVVWGWFLYRYWQHFIIARRDDLDELLALQEQHIVSMFSSQIVAKGNKKIDEHLIARHNGPLTSIEPYKVAMHGRASREGWRRIRGNVRIDGNYVVVEGNVRRSYNSEGQSVTLTAPWIWPSLVRAVLPVNLRHRYFTEYWTAFLFASVPVILKLFFFVRQFS